MADIFVSYAREDKARAEQIARGLEALGLDVFWDSEIPPGQTWADYIEAKLSKCKAVIVLWSEHSTRSQWVREEARMGRDKGTLIPAMLDNSQAPFGFGEVQAANLSTWTGSPDHPDWRRFSEAVRSVVGSTAAPRAASASQPRYVAQPQPQAQTGWQSAANIPAPASKGGIKPGYLIAGAAAVAVLGIGGFMIAQGGSAVSQQQQQQAAFGQTEPGLPVPVPEPAPTTGGDTSPSAIILAQLQQAQQVFSQQGFQQLGEPVTGGMAQGETGSFPITLNAGYDYRVIGVCDRDCSDLDLTLYDQNQTIISQDTSTDDHPVVAVQPSWTGPFTVTALMYNCTVAPCYYALVLYGKPVG
jgi:hypothetical protein